MTTFETEPGVHDHNAMLEIAMKFRASLPSMGDVTSGQNLMNAEVSDEYFHGKLYGKTGHAALDGADIPAPEE